MVFKGVSDSRRITPWIYIRTFLIQLCKTSINVSSNACNADLLVLIPGRVLHETSFKLRDELQITRRASNYETSFKLRDELQITRRASNYETSFKLRDELQITRRASNYEASFKLRDELQITRRASNDSSDC